MNTVNLNESFALAFIGLSFVFGYLLYKEDRNSTEYPWRVTTFVISVIAALYNIVKVIW